MIDQNWHKGPGLQYSTFPRIDSRNYFWLVHAFIAAVVAIFYNLAFTSSMACKKKRIINMYRGTQVLHTFRQICSCTSSMITCAVYMRSYASSLAGLESSLELQEHNVFVLHLPFLLLNQFPCNYDVSKCLINVSVCFILKRKLLSTLWVLFCPRKEYLGACFPFAIGWNLWFFFGCKTQT